MGENENKQTNENVEDLKKQAVETFNQTRDELKNMDIKEEMKKGKGLLGNLFTDPIGTIKQIAQDGQNSYFKTALLIIGIWLIAVVTRIVLRKIFVKYSTYTVLSVIKLVVAPLLKVLVLTVIIHVFNKQKNKSLIKSITLVSIAYVPVVLSAILNLLTIISTKMSDITNPISSLLGVTTTVLKFFVVKEILGKEENKDAFKSFLLVEAIYYVASFILKFLGVSI